MGKTNKFNCKNKKQNIKNNKITDYDINNEILLDDDVIEEETRIINLEKKNELNIDFYVACSHNNLLLVQNIYKKNPDI